MRIATILLASLFGVASGDDPVNFKFGEKTAKTPPIDNFNVFPPSSIGAMLKLKCDEGTFMTTFSGAVPGQVGGVWYDDNGDMVAKAVYQAGTTTFNTPFDLTVEIMQDDGTKLCNNPVLTVDLRAACNDDTRTLFDIPSNKNPIVVGASTAGSAQGSLVIDGGCDEVDATYEYQVGIDDAAPVGDLYCVLTLDLSSCSYINIGIEADTDTTLARDGECSINAHGDPHIKTWKGDYFDYMGACDQVFLHSAAKDNKLGVDVDVHMRSTIRYKYSYIESAAIQIGDGILEVGAFGDHALDGISNALNEQVSGSTVGGFPVHYTRVSDKKHVFDIVASPKHNITLFSFKDLVGVEMTHDHFHKVSGLIGSVEGLLVGRDGVTDLSEDLDAYGQEWQVRDTEKKLFRTARAPQYPEECILPSPDQMESRRLGEGGIRQEAAEHACAKYVNTGTSSFENCVYDVMAVGDLEMAQSGAY